MMNKFSCDFCFYNMLHIFFVFIVVVIYFLYVNWLFHTFNRLVLAFYSQSFSNWSFIQSIAYNHQLIDPFLFSHFLAEASYNRLVITFNPLVQIFFFKNKFFKLCQSIGPWNSFWYAHESFHNNLHIYCYTPSLFLFFNYVLSYYITIFSHILFYLL